MSARRAKGGAARPARLRLTPGKSSPERAEMRSGVTSLNGALGSRGGAFHVANEQKLLSRLSVEDRTRILAALAADGVIFGFPDTPVVWPLPDDWRAALEAAGKDVPPLMAFVGAAEWKEPGWTISGDGRWRNGSQPKAHAWLRARGVPVALVRDAWEFFEAVKAMGCPYLRWDLPPSARHPENVRRPIGGTGGAKAKPEDVA